MRSVARMPLAGDYTQHRKCDHDEEPEATGLSLGTERSEGAMTMTRSRRRLACLWGPSEAREP